MRNLQPIGDGFQMIFLDSSMITYIDLPAETSLNSASDQPLYSQFPNRNPNPGPNPGIKVTTSYVRYSRTDSGWVQTGSGKDGYNGGTLVFIS